VGVGLLAGALALFGIGVLAPHAGATSDVTVTRLAGTNRYGTAQAIAGHSAFSSPAGVIVATGENYPDALAASALAGSKAPAPIVLTAKDSLSSEAKAALDALKAKNVKAATIVGGTAAVSDAVRTAIENDGFTVTRTAGVDRFATAAAIASAAGTPGSIGSNPTALIATGDNFPDALAGGPAAYANHLPILLVHTDSIPSATSSAISSLGIKHAVILGGTAAVSDAVKGQIDSATGTTSDRLAGVNRYGTAAAVGSFEKATLSFGISKVIDATGLNFPDALAAGPLGGQLQAPIVLSASCPTETVDFLKANADTIGEILLSGGTAVIDAATADCLKAAAGGTATNGNTSRPELTAAAVKSTVDTGTGAGTTIRYTFDETVDGVNCSAGDFWAVSADDTRNSGNICSVVTGDAKSVDVRFNGILTTTDPSGADLTLATVDLGAVQDSTGEDNPEGDAPLGSVSTTALPAGITDAPDLNAVNNFHTISGDTANTYVDFVYDEVVDAVNFDGFYLMKTDGLNEVDCTYDSGEGTSTITVQCPDDTAGVALTASQFARGISDYAAVSDSAGNDNTQQAADISNSGNTGTPDLVSATFNTDAKDAANNPVDTATLTFDQPVDANGAGSTDLTEGDFWAYFKDANGGELNPQTAVASTVASSNKQVLLTFNDGELSGAVGITIDSCAVEAASGTNQGDCNEPDEVGVAGTTAGTTGGTTSGPDLTLVVRTAAKDVFGNLTGGWNMTYVFDEDVFKAAVVDPATGTAIPDNPTAFFLYLTDGTRMSSTNGTCFVGPTEDIDNTVTCVPVSGVNAYKVDATGVNATDAQVKAAVLGTVDNGAAEGTLSDGTTADGNSNNEGASAVQDL